MPLDNCPFSALPDDAIPKLYLPVIIYNPQTGLSLSTYGQIDTGADECAIPAWIAKELGHSFKKGKPSDIITGNGGSQAFKHTTTIEILHPKTKRVVYTLTDVPIDYMPKLTTTLLGVRHFLDRFILEANYPRHKFSIKYPKVDARGV